MIAEDSKTTTTPLMDAAERTLGALWDATPDTLALLERWRLVERAAVVLARDHERDTASRALLGLLAVGLLLTIAYALLSIAALAWAAAGVYVLAVAAWAWVCR